MLSIFPSIRVFELALCIRWPNYWSFSFSISPSSEYSGLISFRIDWIDLLAVQGILKSLLQLPQFENTSSSALSLMIQLLHSYTTTGKNMTLAIWTFVSKIMSLLFSMLSIFVITFLPRSKCLFISWLQSSSTVILGPKKIKSVSVGVVFPSICMK